MTNAMGAKVTSPTGTFTFDYATFAPDQSITLVLIGRRDTIEREMTAFRTGGAARMVCTATKWAWG